MKKTIALLVSCFAVTLTAGCSTSPTVTRGQSPHAVGHPGPCRNGYCHQCYKALRVGKGWHKDGGWHPQHCHTYSVMPLQNYTYPQEGFGDATVQYPYYTVKGPDCFFYE